MRRESAHGWRCAAPRGRRRQAHGVTRQTRDAAGAGAIAGAHLRDRDPRPPRASPLLRPPHAGSQNLPGFGAVLSTASFFHAPWHSVMTAAAAAAESGVSLASTLTALPSVVLYILSQSTSAAVVPGYSLSRSDMELIAAALGWSRARARILWSSSPWSMRRRLPSTLTGTTSPTRRGAGPSSRMSSGSLSPVALEAMSRTAGSSQVWGSMP
mmetsp:Transcript_18011/g.52566  ORF Transcript_18011/g.52566 Transcript_18011/m.52566 type:complete len:212 (+) Transcript_18011:171-806(+)